MGSKDTRKISNFLPEIDESVDENSDFYKRNVLPVDKGWAWVICFAGFLVYFVFGVSNQTLVVLFVEIISYYDTTITVASLMFTFSVFSVGFMSIISTNFLAPRFGERVVVSIAGVFNMFGTLGLSFSPNIGVFIIFSVVKGMATGAVFVPSISLIRLYFHNRRSIAQIIANVGQSVAVIITPPLVRIIRKEYGISGTFMIIAGVELHMSLAGLLLRPVTFYRYRPRVPLLENKIKALGEALLSEDYNEFKLKTKFRKAAKRLSLSKRSSSVDDKNSEDSKISLSSHRKSIQFDMKHRRFSSIYPPEEETPDEIKRRRWVLCVVVIATVPASANLYLRNYIPSITEGQGATLDESAFLLTIVGAVDLLSRLSVGLFSDLHILSSVQIISITQLCLATVCHCLRFFTNFETLVVFAVLTGCFVGTRISVMPLLAIEIVGIERMPQALSIISTVGAISSALMNPLFGFVAERYGDYIMVLHMTGVCFTASSFIMIVVPFIMRMFTKQEVEKSASPEASIVESPIAPGSVHSTPVDATPAMTNSPKEKMIKSSSFQTQEDELDIKALRTGYRLSGQGKLINLAPKSILKKGSQKTSFMIN